jgi:hypothetical protein
MGFASALLETGLPDKHVPSALFFFNVGVELGQLAFVIVFIAIARVLSTWGFVRAMGYARVMTAYGVGSLATFWLVERVGAF